MTAPTRFFSFIRPTTIGGLVLVSALALTGCATATGATNSGTSSARPTASSSASAATPATTPVAPAIDIRTGAPAAGTNASIAWEALMGPDGEYAAAASYQAVIDTYGQVEPYTTILSQELKHIASLTRQLERYGVVVPDNPYLGTIIAPADLLTAAQAWADGEVSNVAMYDALIAQSTDGSLTNVLENLRSASLNNHLPLFEQAVANGGTLT